MKRKLLIYICIFAVILCWIKFMSEMPMPNSLVALIERTPHLTVPFSFAEKGYVLTTDFKAGGNLNRTYLYSFSFSFLIDSDNPKRRDFARLFGYGAPPTGSSDESYDPINRWHRVGISIPLKLAVSRIEGKSETVIFKNEYQKLAHGGSSKSTLFDNIESIRLEPGKYRIRLETLEAVPELTHLPVNFEVSVPGK